ncbi:MAG: hypothetical protein LBG07_01375 [Treponema sp.]|jgi:hypothetical protein|nr:hypothetical protein [Treponema sp.]
MINLRWSVIAAAAAFIISLVLGISVRGQILIILIRAFCFAVVFFLLAVLIWRLINKYIPELLHIPSPDANSPMADIEPEGRVNITVGDGEDSIPPNAALPLEGKIDDVGNIADVMNRGPSSSVDSGPGPAESSAASPVSLGLSPEPLSISPAVFVPPQRPDQGMDQGLQSGYTQNRDNVSRVSSPSIQAPAGGFSGLGDTSGSIESLPDLDALAGSFLSPAAAGEDSVLAGQGSSLRPATGARSKKSREVGEDFNPKEVASAIQTIIKRD